MKIAVNKDEMWPFYTLETDSNYLISGGYIIEVPDEEGELLKIMWQEAMDRLNDIENKLEKYYKQSIKEGKKKYEFPDSSSVSI